jgi:amino acid transporter/nucleotide-binding universal stress UspA family protein
MGSPETPSHIALSRNLGLFTITLIGVGAMIGAGIFVLTGIAAGVAGPALLLVYLLNGLVTTLTAMAYAELGSCFPEAGGGYLWVKEGIGGTAGFLSGWMSWFAHVVACSFYAIGFATFVVELAHLAGLDVGDRQTLIKVLLVIIVLAFTAINVRGASETGTVGNIITIAKVGILGLFAIFGLLALQRIPAWPRAFTTDFLPNGLGGVVRAMGLTFIAFEGYEIIAQTGEEARDPKRTIPRAIFLSIAVSVAIYLIIGFVALGAVQAPGGQPSWRFLGQLGELGMAAAAQQFLPYGNLLLLIGGVLSTMSALNATIYSSSRVSFAMGRDRNLPERLGQIHPRFHTPAPAIVASSAIIILMGVALPIEKVASAADIMFLLLFLLVNASLIALRSRRPELDRGYRVPLFPWLTLLAIGCNLGLAVYLFTYSPLAWGIAISWLALGLALYWGVFARREAMARPRVVIHEEVLVQRDYSVLMPLENTAQAQLLADLGMALARDRGGEVLALHVVRVPQQLSLSDGRLFLKAGHSVLDTVIATGQQANVPVHTMIRLGRDIAPAIRLTAVEQRCDLLLFGWPGATSAAAQRFGSVIDPLVADPPSDVAVARLRQRELPQRILLPTAGGPHTALALRVATALAKAAPRGAGTVTLLYVARAGDGPAAAARWWAQVAPLVEQIDAPIGTMVVHSTDVTAAILQAAVEFDAVVLGATREPLFERVLFGTIPELVAARCARTVIMVKSPLHPLASSVRRIARMLSGAPATAPASLSPAAATVELPPMAPTSLSPAGQTVESSSVDGALSQEHKEEPG